MLILFAVHLASADVDPSGLAWPLGSTVNFYYNTSGMPSSSASAIKSARSTWTALAGDITITSLGSSTSRTASLDNKNLWFAQNVGSSGNIVALTTVWYDTTAPTVIIEVDTYLNTYQSFTTTGESTRYDVQDVATHEWGHWGDLLDDWSWEVWDTSNTMYETSYKGSTRRRSLTTEDEDGWCAIYGC